MWQNVSDPNSFNPKVRDLLTELAHQASESPKMYKAGVLKLDESRNLYGLVQCTRDLSSSECFTCLDIAIGELHLYSDCKEADTTNKQHEFFQHVFIYSH